MSSRFTIWDSLRVLAARVHGLLLRRRIDQDFEQEREAHLALLTEENIRRDMTSEEARRAARLRLGGVTELRETHRELHGLPWLDNPPRKKSYRIVLLIWFLGLAIAGWSLAYATTVTHAPETRLYQEFRWFTYAYSFLAALVLAVFWRYNHRIFRRESEIWTRSFMRRCCGEILRPSARQQSG